MLSEPILKTISFLLECLHYRNFRLLSEKDSDLISPITEYQCISVFAEIQEMPLFSSKLNIDTINLDSLCLVEEYTTHQEYLCEIVNSKSICKVYAYIINSDITGIEIDLYANEGIDTDYTLIFNCTNKEGTYFDVDIKCL